MIDLFHDVVLSKVKGSFNSILISHVDSFSQSFFFDFEFKVLWIELSSLLQ